QSFRAVPASLTMSGAESTNDQGGISVGAVASTVLKSGIGLVPMITGLLGLFGGGEKQPETPLVKYAMPEAIHFQAAETEGGITDLDYDQMGMPRGNFAPDTSGQRPDRALPATTGAS